MRTLYLVVFAFCPLVTCGLVRGHEVDQYTLPDDQNLEDLGDHWNEIFDTAVCKGIVSLNREIELANSLPIPAVRELLLAKCHSPGTVAWRVRKQMPIGMVAIAKMELKLAQGEIPRRQEDRAQSFRASTFSSAFSHFPLLPDPRQLGRMTIMRSSVIKVHGNYIGTDKIGHFIGHGYQYFLTYRTSRKLGTCPREAIQHAVNVGTYGPISENMLVGTIPTGVFSNADQAANYLGMKFFINLTEPVQLNGCIHPPMLERDGDYWVRRPGCDKQYFAAFVSEHLDEVLNPCVYSWGMRNKVREEVRHRAENLLDWYAGNDPAKRRRSYFDRVVERCKLYYGEEYGYSGEEDQIITLGDICFSDETETDEPSSVMQLATSSSARQGRFSVDVSTPSIHPLGDSQAYEIVVANQQDEDFENVEIVAEIPEGLHVTVLAQSARFDREASTLTWQVPVFEAGSEHAFLFTAKAVEEGRFSPSVDVGDWRQPLAHTNYVATVKSSPSDVYAENEENFAGRAQPLDRRLREAELVGDLPRAETKQHADLEVDVLGPTVHRLGESKDYEVVVFNASEEKLEDATITFKLPQALRLAKLSRQAEIEVCGGQLTWRLPKVEAGTERVFRFTAEAVVEGSYAPRIVVLNQSTPVSSTTFTARTESFSPTNIAERRVAVEGRVQSLR